MDVVFIGSCTNSRIEDPARRRQVIRGRRRQRQAVLVVPGSGLVKAQAEAEGLDRPVCRCRFRMARAGLFHVSGDERRPPGTGRALCLDLQPQL